MVSATTDFNILMQAPLVSEFGKPVYYWCQGRRTPAGPWSFDKWSKEPFYWTGYLMTFKGPDYARILHDTAVASALPDRDLNAEIGEHLKALAQKRFEEATNAQA